MSGKATSGQEGQGLSRRGFLTATGGIVLSLGSATADGFLVEARRVVPTRAEVAIPGLPSGLEGLSVAHVTDTHLYDGLHPAARHLMTLVGSERPDVVLFTGDLAESPDQLDAVQSMIEACRGRLATVATLGNWEHAVGITPTMMDRTCRAAGASFLLNESLVLTIGGARLALVGLDDPRSGDPDPLKALSGVSEDAVAIWGFHAPGYADELVGQAIPRPALLLAGHTHGGQIRLPPFPAVTPTGSGRFVAGWYRDTFAPLYVSRGIGTADIRARFLCPPEVEFFRLRRA